MQKPTDDQSKQRDEKLNRYIEQQQKRLCGERYKAFTLGRLELDERRLNAIASWVKDPKCFLLWMGAPGTGKTSFAAAMIDYMIRSSYPWSDNPKFRSYRYWREYEFFEKVKASFGMDGDAMTTIKLLVDDDVVFYDDMKVPTEWRRDQVIAMVDIRYCSMLPTIITTNFTKQDIFSIYGAPTGDRLFAKENIIIDTHGQESHRQE